MRYKLKAAAGGGWVFQSDHSVSSAVEPESYERAIAMDEHTAETPRHLAGSMRWIQFESTLPLCLSAWAEQSPHRDRRFREFASGAKRHFER